MEVSGLPCNGYRAMEAWLMTVDPYCGRCHQFMRKAFRDRWVCTCTIGGLEPDNTKDPNCHNSGHDHHDPESPIVLARKAEYAAEEESGCICKGGFVDYLGPPCPVHPILDDDEDAPEWRILPLEELAEEVELVRDEFEIVDGTPFLDTQAELDEILEETNRQVDSECLAQGHLWVKYGKVGFTDAGLSAVDWGPETCMRCGEPAPPLEEPVIVSKGVQISPRRGEFAESVGGPHLCPGCNLRDLTMADAKRLLRHLLIEAPNTKARREAERWLRLDGKIRAMEEED